jgi:3-dehydroquinate synthase
MEDVIALNVKTKRNVVMKDENDTGARQILNFGHTIGHGIEKHSGYRISHGKAVAMGMAADARGACRMGICAQSCCDEIIDMLTRHKLPVETDATPEQLIDAALFDKKRSGQIISVILPESVGKCVIKNFTLDEYAAFVRLGLKAYGG